MMESVFLTDNWVREDMLQAYCAACGEVLKERGWATCINDAREFPSAAQCHLFKPLGDYE